MALIAKALLFVSTDTNLGPRGLEMKNHIILIQASLSLLIFANIAMAQPKSNLDEPAYCDQGNFLTHEITNSMEDELLFRMHSFQLGKTKLVGLAVGISDPFDITRMARFNSNANHSEKYCTWYFNKGNPLAEKFFNWRYVMKPTANIPVIVANYSSVLDSSFDDEPENFVSCVTKNHYLAMGCNDQQHRGPSVFAMVLAYSGCTPLHAVTIANGLWGLNGVPFESRLALAQHGYDLGSANPEARLKMAQAFSE